MIWLYLACGFFAIFIIGAIYMFFVDKKPKIDKNRIVDDTVEIKGVNYSKDEYVSNVDGSANITLIKGDVIIKCGDTVKADKKSDFKPGKYTILATKENVDKFNVRVDGFVREFSHGEEIVVAEGEEICPVSTGIIFR